MKPSKDNKIVTGGKDGNKRINILKEKAKWLHDVGKPFKLIKSGNSYELKSGFWNETASRSGFTFKDLRFIKSVKQYVEKYGIAVDFIDKDYKAERIDYIKVGSFKPGETLTDLVCVDVDYAYWQTAYNLRIISKGIYERGLKEDISKVVRLAALGSLAKNKTIWDFDGKVFKREAVINSKTTENLWFAICKTVGDMMASISREVGDDFVFYWVDGIYIKDKSRALNKVLNAFKERHYGTKIEHVQWVKFEDDGFWVKGDVKDDPKHFDYTLVKSEKAMRRYSELAEEKRLLDLANEVMNRKPDRRKKS